MNKSYDDVDAAYLFAAMLPKIKAGGRIQGNGGELDAMGEAMRRSVQAARFITKLAPNWDDYNEVWAYTADWDNLANLLFQAYDDDAMSQLTQGWLHQQFAPRAPTPEQEMLAALQDAEQCLNEARMFRVNGLPGGMKNSYDVAAKIGKVIRKHTKE